MIHKNRFLIFFIMFTTIMINSNLHAQSTIKIGKNAPLVKMKSRSSGQDFSIKDFRGKVIMLNFVSGWCPSCKKAQMALSGLAGKYRGLQTITISLDQDSTGFIDSLEKEQTDIKFVFDSKGIITQAFQVPLLPSVYLIDQYGKIRYILPGYKVESLKKLEFFLRGLAD